MTITQNQNQNHLDHNSDSKISEFQRIGSAEQHVNISTSISDQVSMELEQHEQTDSSASGKESKIVRARHSKRYSDIVLNSTGIRRLSLTLTRSPITMQGNINLRSNNLMVDEVNPVSPSYTFVFF